MLAWWMLVPTLLAMMVALVLPGFMWLRAGVRSSLIAIGAAPAFTFGLITVLTVLYPAFEISWEASTVMPVLGMSAVGGAVAWGLSYFHRVNGGFALNGVPFREAIGVRVPIGGHQAAIRAATWGAILVGFLLAAWPLLSVADPANPVQQWIRRSIRMAFTRSSTARMPALSVVSMNSTVGGASTTRRAGTRSSRSSPATTRLSRLPTCPPWPSWPCG